MAYRVALSCYSIRFREPNHHKFLSFEDPKLAGLRLCFETYFQGLQKSTVNDTAAKKVLQADSVSTDDSGVRGLLRTGDYGYEADLVDVNGKRPKYRRAKEQAQLLPFFFRLYLPPKGDAAVLILQRFGLFGVRRILEADLGPKFGNKFPEVSMHIWPQVPEGVLDYLLDHGELKTITLRRHTLPTDIADAVSGGIVENGRIDVVIGAKHGTRFQGLLTRVRSRIRKGAGLNDVVELDGFEHDKILLNVEVGDRPQTVDLSNLNKLRAVVDVTNKVTLGPDGHPTFASIEHETEKVLGGIRAALGI